MGAVKTGAFRIPPTTYVREQEHMYLAQGHYYTKHGFVRAARTEVGNLSQINPQLREGWHVPRTRSFACMDVCAVQ